MRTIGIFEAKTHLSEIVKEGEEVCITNRGKEIAVIVPFEKYNKLSITEAFDKLKKLKLTTPIGNYNEIAEMKNMGRK